MMTNKELNLKTLIEYGKRKHACLECIKEYDLPLYNQDKKVSININRTTRAILKELIKELTPKSTPKIRYIKLTYDDVISSLIKKSGYSYIFDKVDENKIILKARDYR